MRKVIQYQNWSTDIFDGFYESNLYNSDTVYYMAECEPTPPDGYEYDIYGWDDFETEVGKYAVNLLDSEVMAWNRDVILNMKFTGISSPCYYNFSTDRIEAEVEVDYDKLCEFCLKTHRDEFNDHLAEYFTDRDGFWSFVANNVIGFEDKLVEEAEKYDQVMLEFYLLSLDYLKESPHDFSEYKRDLYEYANERLWNRLCLEKDGKFYDFQEDENGNCVVGDEIVF